MPPKPHFGPETRPHATFFQNFIKNILIHYISSGKMKFDMDLDILMGNTTENPANSEQNLKNPLIS